MLEVENRGIELSKYREIEQALLSKLEFNANIIKRTKTIEMMQRVDSTESIRYLAFSNFGGNIWIKNTL